MQHWALKGNKNCSWIRAGPLNRSQTVDFKYLKFFIIYWTVASVDTSRSPIPYFCFQWSITRDKKCRIVGCSLYNHVHTGEFLMWPLKCNKCGTTCYTITECSSCHYWKLEKVTHSTDKTKNGGGVLENRFWLVRVSYRFWLVSKNGSEMLRPRTLRPCTFRPYTIRPRTLFPDVFTSLYVSSLNESEPTELHQPCIGWAFSLT